MKGRHVIGGVGPSKVLSLTALRTIALAVCAIGFEVVCLLTFFVALFNLAEIDSIERAPYGLRASGAVATLGLCALTGGVAAFIALRLGRRWLRVNRLGAVFIVAVFNGFAFYFVLLLASLLNLFLWDVPFPLPNHGEFRSSSPPYGV
ncbi:MAG: hypothetical protein HY874_02030 [Chloroflexi bacterium]|nr:hypothetical protein [Chloroflexota bacterium]